MGTKTENTNIKPKITGLTDEQVIERIEANLTNIEIKPHSKSVLKIIINYGKDS